MSRRTAVIIGTIIGVVLSLALSWIITCGFIWLITICFGWIFTWKIATGIWLIAYLLGCLFRNNTTAKK